MQKSLKQAVKKILRFLSEDKKLLCKILSKNEHWRNISQIDDMFQKMKEIILSTLKNNAR